MRHIARTMEPLPAGLAEKKSEEIEAARAYFSLTGDARKHAAKVEFKAYKLASVKAELERMFKGKCAYCESFYNFTAPVDIEHYRPKGQVQEDSAHDGYWWLAAEWTNLLPSCIDCNRKRKQPTPTPSTDLLKMVEEGKDAVLTNTGKKDSFPIAEGTVRAQTDTDNLSLEGRLLLNPCEDEPAASLDFSYDATVGAAIVFPRGRRTVDQAGAGIGTAEIAAAAQADGADLKGAMSIHVYGLNRLALVQARTRVVRRLEFLSGLIVDLEKLAVEVEASDASRAIKDKVNAKVDSMQDRILQEMDRMADPSAEYSAVAVAWLKDFREVTQRGAQRPSQPRG